MPLIPESVFRPHQTAPPDDNLTASLLTSEDVPVCPSWSEPDVHGKSLRSDCHPLPLVLSSPSGCGVRSSAISVWSDHHFLSHFSGSPWSHPSPDLRQPPSCCAYPSAHRPPRNTVSSRIRRRNALILHGKYVLRWSGCWSYIRSDAGSVKPHRLFSGLKICCTARKLQAVQSRTHRLRRYMLQPDPGCQIPHQKSVPVNIQAHRPRWWNQEFPVQHGLRYRPGKKTVYTVFSVRPYPLRCSDIPRCKFPLNMYLPQKSFHRGQDRKLRSYPDHIFWWHGLNERIQSSVPERFPSVRRSFSLYDPSSTARVITGCPVNITVLLQDSLPHANRRPFFSGTLG